uniref:Uncharacterized protein n=1 Tax=Seriola dumerili TaxID=41447 RepID=A0A3B4U617_SERDU
MFDGLNINRGEWKALADVHAAKMQAIEDEKKKLEGGGDGGETWCLKSSGFPTPLHHTFCIQQSPWKPRTNQEINPKCTI